MRYMAVPLEVRELGGGDQVGHFGAHASVFGVKDSYDTYFDKGAFARTLKAQKGELPITFFHMPWMGIGIAHCSEDNTGLLVDGFLNVHRSRDAAEVYGGMPDPSGSNPAAGYYSQMSHGFDPIKEKKDDNGDIHYTEVKSYEVAILMRNFAANPQANIENVRSRVFALQMALRGGSARDIIAMVQQARESLDDGDEDVIGADDDAGLIIVRDSRQVRELLTQLNRFNALLSADPVKTTPNEKDPHSERFLDPQAHSRMMGELRLTLKAL